MPDAGTELPMYCLGSPWATVPCSQYVCNKHVQYFLYIYICIFSVHWAYWKNNNIPAVIYYQKNILKTCSFELLLHILSSFTKGHWAFLQGMFSSYCLLKYNVALLFLPQSLVPKYNLRMCSIGGEILPALVKPSSQMDVCWCREQLEDFALGTL